ncbi:MAG: methylated-DNA--[protein]-cysteine S-methyltransferase [Pseudomonadota bacterium]
MIRHSIGHCALGHFLAGWNDNGLCVIELADSPEQLLSLLQADFPDQVLQPAGPDNSLSLQSVARFIDSPRSAPPDIAISPQGTPFQQSVWRALADIPPGQTISYSQLARRLQKPKAIRAVASACSANRLAVIIPCHRVIRDDGSLGGYRWGLARKQALLQREASI